MDRWSQLSLKDKSELMSLYIQNGISSLEEIKKHYNSFATGGHLYQDGGPDDPPNWYKLLTVAGTTPETSDNSVNYSPQAENTIFKQAVRRQAEVNARVQGRKSPNQQDFNIAYGQLTRQEDKPIEQNFNPITGERQYTKEEQDLMRAQGAGLLTEGLFWALDPIGMAGYSLMNKSPRLFNSNNTLTENLEQEGISPVVAPFIVGGLGSGLTHGISKGVQSAIDRNLQKQLSRAIELDKGLLNIKNEAHNRFRLGDVEINDPNLMYRQTDSRALGEVASGGNRHTMFNRGSLWYGIPTESMLSPVIEPKTVGKLKLTKPNSEVAKTHLLVTRNADMTGANQKFGRVSIGPHSESSLHLNMEKSPEDRWLNEMIREWRNKNSEPGIATYVTDGGSRRVPLEGALNNSNTSIYIFDPGYGYRRIQEPVIIPNYKDYINTKVSLSHQLSDEYIMADVLSPHGSLIIPSTATRPSGIIGKAPTTMFLSKNTLNYPHKSYFQDAGTSVIGDYSPITGDFENMSLLELESLLNKNKEYVRSADDWLEGSFEDVIEKARFNNYLESLGQRRNYSEVKFHSPIKINSENTPYAFTENEEVAKALEALGIQTNLSPNHINKDYFNSLENFIKNVVLKDKKTSFSQGGKPGKVTPYGQWQYPGEVTTIPSNNITMKGVDYPVIGVSNTGDTKYMLPNMDYLFDGQYVTEYPIKRK